MQHSELIKASDKIIRRARQTREQLARTTDPTKKMLLEAVISAYEADLIDVLMEEDIHTQRRGGDKRRSWNARTVQQLTAI